MQNEINITQDEIDSYRKQVITKMLKMGATENLINLLRDGSIKYAIINKKKPEDLAWAIMQ